MSAFRDQYFPSRVSPDRLSTVADSDSRSGDNNSETGNSSCGLVRSLVETTRRSAGKRFVCRIVRPTQPDFQPRNWKEQPSDYEELVELPDPKFRGRADAWRFMFNTAAIRNGDYSTWALVEVV